MNTFEKIFLGLVGTAIVGGASYVLLSRKSVPSPLPGNTPPAPKPGSGSSLAPKPGALVDLPNGLKAMPLLQVADDVPAPLLIVLHGREGTEKQLVSFVPADLGARVFFLRGNIPGPKAKGKFSFYTPRLADPEEVIVPALQAAAGNVAVAIAHLRAQHPTTKVLVLGGSQGGGLAYALAALGDVDGAVSVSGSLPTLLRPTSPGTAGVVGIHGTKDVVVPAAAGKATLDAFAAAGFPLVEWIPIEGGTHALSVAGAKAQAHQALHQLVDM